MNVAIKVMAVTAWLVAAAFVALIVTAVATGGGYDVPTSEPTPVVVNYGQTQTFSVADAVGSAGELTPFEAYWDRGDHRE